MIYGAFVTVRYWIGNLISDADIEHGEIVEEAAKDMIREEGVLSLSDREELVDIQIVPDPSKVDVIPPK